MLSVCAVLALARCAAVQAETPQVVEVVGQAPDREQRPLGKLLRAQRAFDKYRRFAPQAALRFKLFARRAETDLDGLQLVLRGASFTVPLALAEDASFSLAGLDASLLQQEADVVSNRRSGTLAWRPDIRSPGLPPHTRRLGDLRLECAVDADGLGADLATSVKPPAFWALAAVTNPCMVRGVSYAWFADRPVFSISMVAGERRAVLPSDPFMHGPDAPAIFGHMDWMDHLRDRMFTLDIWDTSWPDDTLLEFDDMVAAGDAR